MTDLMATLILSGMIFSVGVMLKVAPKMGVLGFLFLPAMPFVVPMMLKPVFQCGQCLLFLRFSRFSQHRRRDTRP